LVSRRSPELLPAAATVVLVLAAGLQMAMPSSAALPEDSVLAPRRAPEPAEPVARSYPAVLASPIFAPDRAPVTLQAQTAGNLSGYEVMGTAIAGNVSTALVRDTTGRIIRVKPDAILQGWRLVSIDRTQLLFDRDGEQRALVIDMTRAKAGVPHPQVAATSAATSGDNGDDSTSNDDSNNSDDDDDN
jgi:hypothetical protein